MGQDRIGIMQDEAGQSVSEPASETERREDRGLAETEGGR